MPKRPSMSKASRRRNSPYVTGHPMGNMFPPEGAELALEKSRRRLQELVQLIPELRGAAGTVGRRQTEKALSDAVTDYLDSLDYYARRPAPSRESIEKAIQLAGEMKLLLPRCAPLLRDSLKSVAHVVKFEDFCECIQTIARYRLAPRAVEPRGRRKKVHLEVGIAHLEKLWERLSGTPWTRTFDRADQKGKQVYVSSGTTFIAEMIATIDPEEPAGAILAAMKAYSRKKP